MKKLFASGVVLLLCAGAPAQTASSQVNASAAQSTSVSASPGSANAESNTSVRANQKTTVSHSRPQQNTNKENSKPSSGTAAAGQLTSGAALHVVLAKPLDAKKNKQGDLVVAKTITAVKSESGVMIPKGSQVLGHVTQARVRGGGKSESALGIAFDRVVLKNGSELPLNVAIQAVAAAQSTAAMQAGDDTLAGGSAMSSAPVQAGGGGLLGGAGAGAGVLTNTSAGLGGAVGNTLGSTTTATGSLTGELSSNANGVLGMPGMTLQTVSSSTADAGVISSTSQNVHLQSGTQMLLMSR